MTNYLEIQFIMITKVKRKITTTAGMFLQIVNNSANKTVKKKKKKKRKEKGTNKKARSIALTLITQRLLFFEIFIQFPYTSALSASGILF